MTGPGLRDSTTLGGWLVRLSRMSAVALDDITADVNGQFECLERELLSYPAEERADAYRLTCEILEEIAVARKQGGSNFLFFKFLKLKKALSKSFEEGASTLASTTLDKEELYASIVNDHFRAGKSQLPDSLFEFMEIARKSEYFETYNHECSEIPASVPVVFVLNGGAIRAAIAEHQSVNIISGHCIVGFEPNEDKLASFLGVGSRGLLLQDVLVYRHLGTLAKRLGGQVDQILISLDTVYYHHKVHEALADSLSRGEVGDLLIDAAVAQGRVVRRILPESVVRYEHESAYREKLNIILAKGLHEFVVEEVQDYMGCDLSRHPEKARGLAYVAATYLYYPMILQQPAIAVESALNAEIPARIVLPYLKSQDSGHLFAFVGLFPLPDVRMSHGAMYYGDSIRGKVYSEDPLESIESLIAQMSRNWLVPHRCWFVQYSLARHNAITRDTCHPAVCRSHQAELTEDLLRVLAPIRRRGAAESLLPP